MSFHKLEKATIDELEISSLTATVNETQPNASFLTNLLFPSSTWEILRTETVELGLYLGEAEMAPFVKRGSASIMVGGYDESFAVVETPNIRISRPLIASDVLYRRGPGETIFASAGEQRTEARRKIGRELSAMLDKVTTREEWMIAQLVRGQISYSVEDQDSFTITVPRSAENSLDLGGTDKDWDTGVNKDVSDDILEVKRQINKSVQLTANVCVMGKTAAKLFRKLVPKTELHYNNVRHGFLDFTTQFDESQIGAIFLGQYDGIDFWEYSRDVLDEDGETRVPLIRDDYAEFMAVTPAAMNTFFYGSIPDLQIFRGEGLGNVRRFSKSWEEQDPAVFKALLHTRPLPWFKRPDAYYSLKVT